MEYLYALKQNFEIENYRIEKVLGCGGFGIAYLALDLMLEEKVVIKEYLPSDLAVRDEKCFIYPKSTSDHKDFYWGLERFLDEARTLAKFQHPNIVRVRHFFRTNNTAYMVMDYEKGDSLGEVLTKKRILIQEEVDALLYPLLDALKTIHNTNFLHRDIKPSNILIREDFSPVLIDFGAARLVVSSRTRSLTSIVSAHYAPVEQYDSTSKQGPWTDIYALGAVLYRCVTGDLPPEATGRMLKDNLIPAKNLVKKKYYPALLMTIDACLQRRPENRPQTIDDIKKLLPTLEETPEDHSHKPFFSFILGMIIISFTMGAGIGGFYLYSTYNKKNKDNILFEKANSAKTEEGFTQYITDCTLCSYKKEAIESIEDIRIYQRITQQDTIKAYQSYLNNCDLCLYKQEALSEIENRQQANQNMLQDPLKDGGLGPVMVFIPRGYLSIHYTKAEGIEEIRDLNIPQNFYIGAYEITIEEYLQFVEATKSHYPVWLEPNGEYNLYTGSNNYYKPYSAMLTNPKHPIVGISLYDALAYTHWLSEQTGFLYRLPTEIEWEYAARANQKTDFWWGNIITPDQANYNGEFSYQDGPTGINRKTTLAVDSFSSNPWGLYNVHGNVWEWTCSLTNLAKCHYNNPPNTDKEQTIRGGSWDSGPDWLTFQYRGSFLPQYRGKGLHNIGFRILRQID